MKIKEDLVYQYLLIIQITSLPNNMFNVRAFEFIKEIINSRNKRKCIHTASTGTSLKINTNESEDLLDSSITDDENHPSFTFWVGKIGIKLCNESLKIPCTVLPFK